MQPGFAPGRGPGRGNNSSAPSGVVAINSNSPRPSRAEQETGGGPDDKRCGKERYQKIKPASTGAECRVKLDALRHQGRGGKIGACDSFQLLRYRRRPLHVNFRFREVLQPVHAHTATVQQGADTDCVRVPPMARPGPEVSGRRWPRSSRRRRHDREAGRPALASYRLSPANRRAFATRASDRKRPSVRARSIIGATAGSRPAFFA